MSVWPNLYLHVFFQKLLSRSNLFIIRADRQQNPFPILIYVYYDFPMIRIPFQSLEHDRYLYRKIAQQLLSNFWNQGSSFLFSYLDGNGLTKKVSQSLTKCNSLVVLIGIPMIYGIDAVHGHNNIYKATIFPHNVGLGATR